MEGYLLNTHVTNVVFPLSIYWQIVSNLKTYRPSNMDFIYISLTFYRDQPIGSLDNTHKS